MSDILMLPYQSLMYSQLHEQAALSTGRSYCIAGDLIEARNHIKAEGAPKLAVIDFGWARGILNSSDLDTLQKLPAVLIYGVRNDSSIHRDFNFIATLGSEDQYTSILPDMMAAALEQIEARPAVVMTVKKFKPKGDQILAKPSRPVDLLTLPDRRFKV